MTYEEMRQQRAEVARDMQSARNDGLALAANSSSSQEQLEAAAMRLETLRSRAAILDDAIAAEEARAAEHLNPVSAAGVDRIKMAADKFHGSGDFLSCVARSAANHGRDMDPRLAEYASIRSTASGQNVTVDAEGGFLVPPDFSEELLTHAQSASVLFPHVSNIPITGNRLIEKEIECESREDATSHIKGRNGGLLAYWTAEAEDYTASKFKTKQIQTDLEKLTGLCYATEELMEDLPALGRIITDGFQDEFAFKIDDAILNGTGSGAPLGIYNAGNTALVKIAKESGQSAGTITLNNILKMYNAMPAANRANAMWIINQDVEIELLKLLMQTGTFTAETSGSNGTVGMPVFLPGGSIANAPNGVMLNRPLLPVEQAAALGSVGDIGLVDLSQYRWVDKNSIKAQTSIHVHFIQDEQAFKFTYRAGGRPLWSNAIKAYKGGTMRSPYVALAERA